MNQHFLSRILNSFFFLFAIVSCEAQTNQKASKIKGISFVATRNVITSKEIQPVKEYNANYAAVIPYGFMRDTNNPEIFYNTERQWWGERMDGAKTTIELFHQANMKVMLKPQIWISRGEYTGTIQLPSKEHWDQLETSYTRYIMDYAKLAQEMNVEMLCIGTELESFVIARPAYWNQLIKKIRRVYKGKLTYAGNWDSYKQVPFWNQMDFIGVDAYFPVSDQKTPDIATATAGWEKWKTELSSLSRKHNKKILFTEYGYVSADYAGKEPWSNADEGRNVNNKAQQILLQAQYDSVWNQEWFAGGFLWKHHAEPNRRGYEKRFTPQGKPAEKTVRSAYIRL